jgi:hypothetical protein
MESSHHDNPYERLSLSKLLDWTPDDTMAAAIMFPRTSLHLTLQASGHTPSDIICKPCSLPPFWDASGHALQSTVESVVASDHLQTLHPTTRCDCAAIGSATYSSLGNETISVGSREMACSKAHATFSPCRSKRAFICRRLAVSSLVVKTEKGIEVYMPPRSTTPNWSAACSALVFFLLIQFTALHTSIFDHCVCKLTYLPFYLPLTQLQLPHPT